MLNKTFDEERRRVWQTQIRSTLYSSCSKVTKCSRAEPKGRVIDQVPVVQRPDNFIQWISHYPTVSICANISIIARVQANMHTLTTAELGSVLEPWATFNVKYILDPE